MRYISFESRLAFLLINYKRLLSITVFGSFVGVRVQLLSDASVDKMSGVPSCGCASSMACATSLMHFSKALLLSVSTVLFVCHFLGYLSADHLVLFP